MITVDRIKTRDPKHSAVIVLVDIDSMPIFKELVHRATNLWPDAPVEVKEFSDQICNQDMLDKLAEETGKEVKALQDYQEYRINQPKKD